MCWPGPHAVRRAAMGACEERCWGSLTAWLCVSLLRVCISVRCVHLCVYGADGTSNRMYVPQACVNWIKTTSKDQSYSCGILFLVVFWDVFRKCTQILEIH